MSDVYDTLHDMASHTNYKDLETVNLYAKFILIG